MGPDASKINLVQSTLSRGEVNHASGLLLAVSVSLLLHCTGFAAVWYCSSQASAPSREIVFETVQLGNIGGNPGSVPEQKKAQENTLDKKPENPAEHPTRNGIEQSLIMKASLETMPDEMTEPLIMTVEKEETRKPTLNSVQMIQLVHKLKQSIPERVTLMSKVDWSLPQVKLPDLVPTNPDLLQFRWEDVELKVAGIVAAIHHKQLMDNKKKQEEQALRELVRVVKEMAAAIEASQKVAVEKGNAPTSGNNRSGIGNSGSGGNNNGESRPASTIPEYCLLPSYPFEAYRRKQQGVVTVSFRCLSSGLVTDVKVTKSSGSKYLDDAAVEAVERWKLKPAMSQGVVCDVTLTKEIGFRIE